MKPERIGWNSVVGLALDVGERVVFLHQLEVIVALIGTEYPPVVHLVHPVVDVWVSEVNPSLALYALAVIGVVVLLVSHFSCSPIVLIVDSCFRCREFHPVGEFDNTLWRIDVPIEVGLVNVELHSVLVRELIHTRFSCLSTPAPRIQANRSRVSVCHNDAGVVVVHANEPGRVVLYFCSVLSNGALLCQLILQSF